MAMGPANGQAAKLQIEMVCVDELVAAGDRLRRLDGLVDRGFVRAEAGAYYAADLGRPSIDRIRAGQVDAGRCAGGDRLDARAAAVRCGSISAASWGYGF